MNRSALCTAVILISASLWVPVISAAPSQPDNKALFQMSARVLAFVSELKGSEDLNWKHIEKSLKVGLSRMDDGGVYTSDDAGEGWVYSVQYFRWGGTMHDGFQFGLYPASFSAEFQPACIASMDNVSKALVSHGYVEKGPVSPQSKTSLRTFTKNDLVIEAWGGSSIAPSNDCVRLITTKD